ncbi:unnamed protein product [Moneuplotes crassus]|uniref:Uncharacterized protein n=1 Tax=Euplotes crassus TaxID=5936 RepID=A0AAD1XK08_EUPCR|nr:unnamed protein product [Moneuplotes crassus]
MASINHHSLLSSALNKIARRDLSKTRQKDHIIEETHNIFNRRGVRNALTRNTSISVGERFRLFKSYEDAMKHDRKALIKQQEKICSKLSIAKPPKPPSGITTLNKNLMIVKKNSTLLKRKQAFIEESTQSQSFLLKPKMANLSSSCGNFTTLKTMIDKEDYQNGCDSSKGSDRGKTNLSISKSFIECKSISSMKSFNSSIKPIEPNSSLKRMNLKILPGLVQKFKMKNKLSIADDNTLNNYSKKNSPDPVKISVTDFNDENKYSPNEMVKPIIKPFGKKIGTKKFKTSLKKLKIRRTTVKHSIDFQFSQLS